MLFFFRNLNETLLPKIGNLNSNSFLFYFNSLNLTPLEKIFTAQFFYTFLKFIVIPVFLLLIFIVVFFLIINRFKSEKLVSKKKKIDASLNDFLTEIIFSNYGAKEIKSKIAQFKKTIPYQEKWCRYLILNKIIHLKQNINDLDQNQLLLIYKYFGLQAFSRKLLRHRKWYFKSLGIYHYQILDYKIKKGSMKPFLKSKNKYLRSNALIATIALSDEKFGVLDNYTEKISRADELKILDIIYHKKSKLPKNITHWLTHENNSIVILALKLMIRYKKNLTLSQINNLLLNADDLVRKETLLAIREVAMSEANEILIAHYDKETNKRNKISCLKTLGVIGNEKTKSFASQILSRENDLEIKFEIVSCINKLDKAFFDNHVSEDENENNIISKIVLHVTNPYLN
nr:hypothetical protein [uncultured Flavobacterium sp.]